MRLILDKYGRRMFNLSLIVLLTIIVYAFIINAVTREMDWGMDIGLCIFFIPLGIVILLLIYLPKE